MSSIVYPRPVISFTSEVEARRSTRYRRRCQVLEFRRRWWSIPVEMRDAEVARQINARLGEGAITEARHVHMERRRWLCSSPA